MSTLTPAQLEAVAVLMAEAGAVTVGPLDAALIAGGRSNLTYAITDGARRWVLRTPPLAGRTASAHDVAREHLVTAALMVTGVPVADAVLIHEAEDVLGVPFTVSSFVDGVAVRTQADLAAYDDQGLAVVMDSMLATLATLHRLDHVAVGLESFGRPDGYAARQLRRWSGQWDTVGDERLDLLAQEVAAKLADAVPEQRSSSIVHGDYRIDNTLLVAPGSRARVQWPRSSTGSSRPSATPSRTSP